MLAEALTDTFGLVWPASHTIKFKKIRKQNGYYRLTKADLNKMAVKNMHSALLPLRRGHVMIMQGGRTVHGSPAADHLRWVTYSNFRCP